jgi:hypothetical protein
MNLPTSVVITGIDTPRFLRQALEAVKTFRPMSSRQVAALLRRTAKAASKGHFELFKTSDMFDATAKNPKWLG